MSFTFGKPSHAINGDISDQRNVNGDWPQRANRLSPHLQRVSETLDDIFAGLVALGSEKLQSFVADAVPGFSKQYDAISRHRSGSSVQAVNRDFGGTTRREEPAEH